MPYSQIFDGVVIPRPFNRLPDPPRTTAVNGDQSSCGTIKWARDLGGVEPETAFSVYLEGLADRTVTLDRVDVEVSERRAAMVGTRIDCIAGARSPARVLAVDLDAQPATVEYRAPGPRKYRTRSYRDPATGRKLRVRVLDYRTSFGAEIERPFLFTLRRGEIEIFLVSAFPQRCWCTWRLKFHYVSAGQRGTLTVPDESKPAMQTTPPSRAISAHWEPKRGWTKSPPPPRLQERAAER
jgi:hypothetical protein